MGAVCAPGPGKCRKRSLLSSDASNPRVGEFLQSVLRTCIRYNVSERGLNAAQHPWMNQSESDQSGSSSPTAFRFGRAMIAGFPITVFRFSQLSRSDATWRIYSVHKPRRAESQEGLMVRTLNSKTWLSSLCTPYMLGK